MCGWGGIGHAGARGPGTPLPAHAPSLRPQSRATDVTPSGYREQSSYVNPNARCPVCQAHVFFYQSPDGGKVYFDDLGPPWPKHPCTSDSSRKPRVFVAGRMLKSSGPAWYSAGWRPFICREIRVLPNNESWCRISGSYGGQKKVFFAKSEVVPAHTLMHAREENDGWFKFSYFLLSADGNVVHREFGAQSSPPGSSVKLHVMQTAKVSPTTALGLALQAAQSKADKTSGGADGHG